MLPKERIVTVLQNVDSLYWHSAGEAQDFVEAVEVSSDVMCVFSATPLEKYEHYRLCIERWKQERPRTVDLAPCFYNLIRSLFSFLDVDLYSTVHGPTPRFLVDELPEVWCGTSAEQFDRMLIRRMGSKSEAVRRKLKQWGSCFVPEQNAIVAREFRMPWAAEQAARCVRQACGGKSTNSNSVTDDFYARVLDAALAFVGSKILCPSRKLVCDFDLSAQQMKSEAEVEQMGFSYTSYMELLDFMVLHRDYEHNQKRYACLPSLITAGIAFDGWQRELAIETLGHLLGSDLYVAYVSGAIAKSYVRRMFMLDLTSSGAARRAYFEASAATVRD
jgi:hypothetical protein